jgi:hypothetical protein
MLAHARNVRPTEDGRYLVGCQIVRRLSCRRAFPGAKRTDRTSGQRSFAAESSFLKTGRLSRVAAQYESRSREQEKLLTILHLVVGRIITVKQSVPTPMQAKRTIMFLAVGALITRAAVETPTVTFTIKRTPKTIRSNMKCPFPDRCESYFRGLFMGCCSQ